MVFGPEVEGGRSEVCKKLQIPKEIAKTKIISTLCLILLGVVKLRRMRWVEHVALQKRRDA